MRIDDEYQKTLANLRQWGMLKTTEPGLLCTVGLLDSTGTQCLTGATITGLVPFFFFGNNTQGAKINVPAGRKVLSSPPTSGGETVYYEQLQSFLDDPQKITGKLWKNPVPTPVPVQLARFGIYLHVLQDSSSHSTFCGDDAPSPPRRRSRHVHIPDERQHHRAALVRQLVRKQSAPRGRIGRSTKDRTFNAVLQLVLLRRTGRLVIGWSAWRQEGAFGPGCGWLSGL